MSASTSRSGVDIRIVLVAAIALLLIVGGAATWAYATNADLERSRQTLATTSTDLAGTKTTLAAIQGNLAEAAKGVASEQEAIKSDKTRVTALVSQVASKDACIKTQSANLAEIRRILALQRANFNRTTSSSTWYRANAAKYRALDLAIADMAKAYSSAAAGSRSTANSWVGKSNAQVRAAQKQVDISNKEVDKYNAAVAAIIKASDAFALTLDKAASTCGG